MHPNPVPAVRSSRAVPVVHIILGAALALSLTTGAVACGPVEPAAESASLAQQHQELGALNGFTLNGLSANGLSANGLSLNGLSLNGLSLNGLSAPAFISWFAQAPAHADMVMSYIVRCAVPAGQSRTYTEPETQAVYTWHGGLGLAPVWASGQPPNLAEQQLISACLAAHANKFGVSVPISVLGRDAAGQFIPFSDQELHQYSRRDACFFGNLFTGEDLFFGMDGKRLHENESSTRACALTSGDPALLNACSPLHYAGKCNQLCVNAPGEKFYLACTVNGVTYRALTTRVRKADIHACGDGICQITESCGRGKRPQSCEKDCGRCPGDQGD